MYLSDKTSSKTTIYFAALAALFSGACEELPRTYSSGLDQVPPLFSDDFSEPKLGPSWKTTGEGAKVVNGHLEVEGLHNHPVWLTVPLPDDVQIEFDVWADSEEGDIKVELAGDGKSWAKSVNYRASGYVLIFGGWNNTLNVIARKDEHGKDRKVTDSPTVEAKKRYHMRITRESSEIRWEVDGRELLTYDDPRPLQGNKNRYFAFNNWESPVSFDNLVIRGL